MSRCGPPGRTATERTSRDTGTRQNPASIGRGAPADGPLDPEAEAWIEATWQECMDAGHPVSRRRIRQQLLRDWARSARAEDEKAVLTFIRHGAEISRSVPVDGPVGERVASMLAGAR